MHVVLIEPSFPDNQKQFARALHDVGATVIGIGERPKDWLDGDVAGWLSHYEQVPSVVDEGRLHEVVRGLQQHVEVDRLEATVEAHVMAAARVREACGIPGTSERTAFLCRDKPAMKDVLRQAGIRCAASTAARSGDDVRRFAVGGRVPARPQAGGRGRSVRRRTGQRPRRAVRGHRPQRRRPRRRDRRRGVRRGPRGLLRHDHHRRRGGHGVRHPLLPERAGGDADAVDLAAVRRHQPHRRRARLRRGQADGPGRDRRPRHRHLGHPHGVVRRAEGAVLLRDRLPPARRALLGPLRRRQRHRHLPRVGDGRRPRATSPRRPRGGSPPASSPCGPTATARSRATRGSTTSSSGTASG